MELNNKEKTWISKTKTYQFLYNNAVVFNMTNQRFECYRGSIIEMIDKHPEIFGKPKGKEKKEKINAIIDFHEKGTGVPCIIINDEFIVR